MAERVHVATSLIAIVTGLLMVNLIQPGVGAELGFIAVPEKISANVEKLDDTLLSIIPTNPLAGLVMIAIILKAVGLPLEGLGLILAVDRVLDMMRSTTNLWSDAKSEGETGIPVLRGSNSIARLLDVQVRTGAVIHPPSRRRLKTARRPT
jgi:Na+/H+-dicarboxylate symporter